MLVSILTPNFNSASYIEETYKSILEQTHVEWEWIVVDDGSTDLSPSIIEGYATQDARIRFYRRTHQPKGASACRNIGIENAKGIYIMFLDADDLLSSSCLNDRVGVMQTNTKLDFGVFAMRHFTSLPGDGSLVNRYYDSNEDYLLGFLSYELPWPISCPLWRRSFIEAHHIRFSEHYQRLQDPELHTKVLLVHNPCFEVFRGVEADCHYRQPAGGRKPAGRESLSKTTQSVLLYYTEMHRIISRGAYDRYLDRFAVNIFHSLLFYTNLSTHAPVAELYRQMNKIRPIVGLFLWQIYLFGWLNRMRLTFVKGVGVSRLWKVMIEV